MSQDVDIVVLGTSSADEERLKWEIIARDPQFYLVEPKSRLATYKVLWRRTGGFGGKCKVDILATGTLNIPNVPAKYVIKKPVQTYNLPVMPFIPLLCLKVQAWAHHRVADQRHLRAKVTQDYFDIQELLRVAKENGYRRKDRRDAGCRIKLDAEIIRGYCEATCDDVCDFIPGISCIVEGRYALNRYF